MPWSVYEGFMLQVRKKTVVPPGKLVQGFTAQNRTTLPGGAPAASNPHSCSPGLEPLQSPAVPPALETARPGGTEL